MKYIQVWSVKLTIILSFLDITSEYIPTTVFERWNNNQQRSNCLMSPMQQEQSPLIFPPSPTPSIELCTFNCNFVLAEQPANSLYPPSPPDSNGAPSPVAYQYFDAKMSEPVFASQTDIFEAPKKDYQLLREHLQDLSFQKKHNLKPLPLESLLADEWDVQDDIEPVISLALEQARKDVEQTCQTLNISSGNLPNIFRIYLFFAIFLDILINKNLLFNSQAIPNRLDHWTLFTDLFSLFFHFSFLFRLNVKNNFYLFWK